MSSENVTPEKGDEKLARSPNPNEEKAKKLYKKGKKLVEIASQLGVPASTVRRWKSEHDWDGNNTSVRNKKNERSEKTEPKKKKIDGRTGNKNSVGHRSSVPKRNQNATKHGLFAKCLPEETLALVEEFEKSDPLDIIWQNITISYAAILRAQKIMYVENKDDVTETKVKESQSKTGVMEEWEVQQAWDKQAIFLKAQARAQSELRSLIRQYMEMLYNCFEYASEEQKARIERIRCDIATKSGMTNQGELTKLDEMLAAVKSQSEEVGGNDSNS